MSAAKNQVSCNGGLVDRLVQMVRDWLLSNARQRLVDTKKRK